MPTEQAVQVTPDPVAAWVKDETKPQGLDATLEERGSPNGIFAHRAVIEQRLKQAMRDTPGWNNLTPSQMSALEMVQHKISRILNGDPNCKDHWFDLAGYSMLVCHELDGALV